MTKPHLAKYVKHYTGLALDNQVEEGAISRVDLSFLTKEERLWIRENWLRSDVYRENICNAAYGMIMEKNNWDAVTALLLSLFSETLESINMVSRGRSTYPCIDAVARRHLPHLRKVTFTSSDPDVRVSLP